MTDARLTLVVMAAGYLRPGRTRLRYGMPPVMHCSVDAPSSPTAALTCTQCRYLEGRVPSEPFLE
eukprot:4270329-Prymnesium_polylepis.1